MTEHFRPDIHRPVVWIFLIHLLFFHFGPAAVQAADSGWVALGPPFKAYTSIYVDVDASRHALSPSVAATDSFPFLGWIELNSHGVSQVHVGRWDRSGWIRDSGTQNMDSDHRTLDLSLGSDGKVPYLAWIEMNDKNIPQLYVKHRTGDRWVSDGKSLNLDPAQRVVNPALAATESVPYLAWSEASKQRVFQVHVSRLLDDGWHLVGDESLNVSTTRDAIEPAIALQGSAPYLAWLELSDRNVYQVRVKHWTGSSWELLGQSLNLDTTRHASSPSITFLGETPYVAWTETDSDGIFQLHVKHWADGAWSSDGNGLNRQPAHHVLSPSLVGIGDALYLAWTEYEADGNTQIRVSRRTGDRWESIDPQLDAVPPRTSAAPSLAGWDAAVYIAWKEVSASGQFQIVVKRRQKE